MITGTRPMSLLYLHVKNPVKGFRSLWDTGLSWYFPVQTKLRRLDMMSYQTRLFSTHKPPMFFKLIKTNLVDMVVVGSPSLLTFILWPQIEHTQCCMHPTYSSRTLLMKNFTVFLFFFCFFFLLFFLYYPRLKQEKLSIMTKDLQSVHSKNSTKR